MDLSEAFAHEKLSPVLAHVPAPRTSTTRSTRRSSLVADGGYGHTASIYIERGHQQGEDLNASRQRMKTCRILINTPSISGRHRRPVQLQAGAVPDAGLRLLGRQLRLRERRRQAPAEHQDCCQRRENMLWFRAPAEGLFQEGLHARGPERAGTVMGKKRCLHRHRRLPVQERLHQADRRTSWMQLGIQPHHASTTLRPTRPSPALRRARSAMTAVQAGLHHRHRRRLRDGRGQDHVGDV